ncbi:hypothetical protein [Methanoregula sp.]|jgi:hypothetical protein|uniref:hypothetical protein n=1 Tax=Methanoregula sp. TaxID=2052170 RepID=UPI0025EA7D85|nr:hypothetical protein [Methanoregula sp.]
MKCPDAGIPKKVKSPQSSRTLYRVYCAGYMSHVPSFENNEIIHYRKKRVMIMMELKHSIALIHICAIHASSDRRNAAITEYLAQHPEINRKELLMMMPEIHID